MTRPPERDGPSLLPVHYQLLYGSALVQLMPVGFEGLTRAINREPLAIRRSAVVVDKAAKDSHR